LSNLVKRTLSGIIYLIVIIGALFLGKYAYGTVFLAAGIIALLEYFDLNGMPRFSQAKITGLVIGAFLFVLSCLVASRVLEFKYFSVIVLLLMFSFLQALYVRKEGFMTELSKALTGVLYIFIPLSLLNYLVFFPAENFLYTHRIVLGILSLVWINDTGAYVTGSLFGKHKLFPRVSPGKSWEGFVGGTLFTIAAGWWMDRIMGILTNTDWLILAMVVSVFGVFGDLTESLIKRNANRKDSGTLIPGHGGMLDRIDSLLFVIPVSVVYLMLS
jgi:phosphatidate cytidylyltransferase